MGESSENGPAHNNNKYNKNNYNDNIDSIDNIDKIDNIDNIIDSNQAIANGAHRSDTNATGANPICHDGMTETNEIRIQSNSHGRTY